MLRLVLIIHILCYVANGHRTINHDKTRMLNGRETAILYFPYLVGIGYYLGRNEWIIACSGTIISRHAVLTAASCQYFEAYARSSKIMYIISNTSYFKEPDKFHSRRRIVMQITDHPDFVPQYAAGRYTPYNLNDLAVMKVPEHEAFNNELEPFYPRIVGPKMKLYEHMDSMHPLLSSVAYGIDQFNYTLTSKELLATPFAYECQKFFGYFPAQNSLCVHAPRRTDPVSCGLDRGGPLIWRGVLIGVGFLYSKCGPILHGLPKYTEFPNLQKSYEFIKKHADPNVMFINDLLILQ